MRILLTGANGFIGQHLLRALLAEGHHVLSAGRSAPQGADPRLDSIHADFAHDTEQSSWLARRLPVVRLQIRMRDIARDAARTDTEPGAQYWRHFRTSVTPGVPAFIAFVTIFRLMVAKPV